jgi:hypothetical protein
MPVFRMGTRVVLFIHIPKCAGTSIETMLKRHPACYGVHGIETGKDNAFNATAFCSPQHFHSKLLQAVFALERFDFIFTIIRDPLSRLLSEHTMQIQRQETQIQLFDEWYKWVRSIRVGNPFAFDNHLRPAAEFIVDQCHVFDLSDGLSNIWQHSCNLMAVDTAASQIQRIKPCGGVNASALSVSDETKRLVASDYEMDYRLRQRFLALRSTNRPWVLGSDLL